MARPLPRPVRIHYRRPPDREQLFEQTLVHEGPAEAGVGEAPSSESPGLLVTYLAEAGVPDPVTVAGRVVLEARSPVVWFTFPGAHHDIGRFHTPAGDFTGYYANVLTPVEILPPAADGVDRWRTTDLFLDVFLTPDGDVHILDQDELRTAVREGWIDATTARVARDEAHHLAALARRRAWPPPVVEDWTLERARTAAGRGGRDG